MAHLLLQNHVHARIPLAHLAAFFLDCCKTAGADHIVSVGSGTGAYEFELTEGRPELRQRLILVDPAPDSFQQKPKDDRRAMAPHFAATRDLVAARPEVVGRCILLLLWPHWELTYDVEAVEVLQPLGIVSLTEALDAPHNCAAGSPLFHATYLSPSALASAQSDYRCIVEACYHQPTLGADPAMTRFVNSGWTRRLVKLSWLARRGASIPKHRPASAQIPRLAKATDVW